MEFQLTHLEIAFSSCSSCTYCVNKGIDVISAIIISLKSLISNQCNSIAMDTSMSFFYF